MGEVQRCENLDTTILHKSLFIICILIIVLNYYASVTTDARIADPKFRLLGPNDITETVVIDTYDQLIDLKDFTFVTNPQTCRDYPAGLLLLVIISSNPNNQENRLFIRKTWGQNLDSTKILFLVGQTDNSSVGNLITNEIETYGDIIQGSFTDAYRNMTYKHVMGLKWVHHHCSKAKYVLKTDDDVVVNMEFLRHFLARELSPWGAKDLIACQVLENAGVQRWEGAKWRVTPEEYPFPHYPTYCAGWVILYSQDVVSRLLKEAQSTPYFWIDDVHITGVVADSVGVARTPLSSLMLTQTKANLLQIYGSANLSPFLFGPPDLTLDKMNKIWNAM